MNNLKRQFGFRLRYLRRQRNLTQEQLAELSGLSVDFISLVERGINAPSFENIEKFAQVLNVQVRDLFTFKESEKTDLEDT
jgi:transcriptional regulator with XRE-family HTH domain